MLETSQTNVHLPSDLGPLVQVYLNQATLFPTGGNTSPLLQAGGYPNIAIAATSTLAGSISVQRYLDEAGTIAQGPAVTQALTANTPGVLNINDYAPFLSFKVTITGGGVVSGAAALLNSR